MNRNKPRYAMTDDPFILPALVDKKFASRYLSSPTLVDRMLWATRHTDDQWLEIVVNRKGSPNGRTLIYSGSLDVAVERLRRGEEPPHIGNPQVEAKSPLRFMKMEQHPEYPAARAIALLNMHRHWIPANFGETKNVCWLLDADDSRAGEIASVLDPSQDIRQLAKAAGHRKHAVSIHRTDLSELNAYLHAQGHAPLPSPPLNKGYLAVCSAGAFTIRESDTPEQCLLSF